MTYQVLDNGVLRNATSEEAQEIQQRQSSIKDNAKAEKWEEIKAERERRLMHGGMYFNKAWYHTDMQAQAQYLSWARKADQRLMEQGNMNAPLTIAGTNQPIMVKRMDNSFAVVTAKLAHDLIKAIEPQMAMTYAAAEAHKAKMEASADPSSYDFSKGWPAVFVKK